jgi:hypothetical protein
VLQVFTWSHVLCVENAGQMGLASQHMAFRGVDGALMHTPSRMATMVTREFQRLQEFGAMPQAVLNCNTLRHM